MDIYLKLIFALVFYVLMTFFYFYSKGKVKVRKEKQDKYLQWVEENGAKSAKAIATLATIFTILFALSLF